MTPRTASKRWSSLLDPYRGRRGRGPGAAGARTAGRRQPADAAVVHRQVRARRRRRCACGSAASTSAATMRCTAACCRCCSTRCSAWSSMRRAGRSVAPAFLHVDYRKVTPIDTELTARGWIRETEGRKAFVNAELRDPDGQPARRGQRIDDPVAARPALTEIQARCASIRTRMTQHRPATGLHRLVHAARRRAGRVSCSRCCSASRSP